MINNCLIKKIFILYILSLSFVLVSCNSKNNKNILTEINYSEMNNGNELQYINLQQLCLDNYENILAENFDFLDTIIGKTEQNDLDCGFMRITDSIEHKNIGYLELYEKIDGVLIALVSETDDSLKQSYYKYYKVITFDSDFYIWSKLLYKYTNNLYTIIGICPVKKGTHLKANETYYPEYVLKIDNKIGEITIDNNENHQYVMVNDE